MMELKEKRLKMEERQMERKVQLRQEERVPNANGAVDDESIIL